MPTPNYQRKQRDTHRKQVPHITTDFPMIDLQEATRELNNSTDDRKIQALTVPKQDTMSTCY